MKNSLLNNLCKKTKFLKDKKAKILIKKFRNKKTKAGQISLLVKIKRKINNNKS